MTSVSTAFLSLADPPPGDCSLMATGFPGHANHRVAKDGSGCAVVLVRTREDSSSAASIPIRTEYLRVVYSTPYKISYASGESREEIFTAITCLSQEPSFIRYFLSVIASLLDSVGADPTVGELSTVIRTVVQLFRALTLPAANTTQGVWAELFLIATSRDKALLASAWHARPEDRHDFMRGRERVEVKSSGRRERRHHFSLDQLSPPAGTKLVIASLFVERAGGGVSLESLLAQACDGVSSGEAARLRYLTAETLGAGLPSALEVAFDFELAGESLRYYDSTVVPRPSLPLPVEISEVRYVADISRAQSVAMNAVEDSALLLALPEVATSPSR